MADNDFATLVSATTALNSATNPIFNQLSNGTTAVEVGGGTEAAALRVTIASDSTGLLSIDDNGGSITVDGAVTVSATDLDIRDLSETTDHVLVFANTVKDGSGTDYVPLVDADGHLQVDILSGGGSNASVVLDDSAFTPAVSSVTAVGFIADETATDSVDEGDIGAPRMTLDRMPYSVIGAALPAGTNNIGDVDIASALPAGTNNIGDVDVLTVPAPLSTTGGGTEATALRVTIANDSTGLLSIDDNGGSITVDGAVTVSATDLDIRDLTSVSDSVEVLQDTHDDLNANVNLQINDVDVSATVPVPISATAAANTALNPIYVSTVDAGVSSTEIHDYDTATVAGSGTDNHDYTVTGTTFFLKQVDFSCSGAMKVEVQTGPVASLATVFVGFIPKAGGEGSWDINHTPREVPVTSTGTVRVIRTNREGSSNDVYSTIIGNDV